MGAKKIGGVLLIILIIGYFIYDISKNTTYEELVTDLIDENETVEQISFYRDVPYMTSTVHTAIHDQDLISEIMTTDMKMKRISPYELPAITSTMVIQTDRQDYKVGFDANSIMIGSIATW
ncbi:hypothetical protein M3557_02430 [Bhargavaea ginsengi]|uniref:hypothetical protein n=1 Tax=Bhargavaea ginsengi TaxID=426757 RepID=UPI00203C93A1|nr:hypothetical protein [Bhargavaea ginsengi]MCM3086765.1 hypothetical protein [Bhargavaea ginsengi]